MSGKTETIGSMRSAIAMEEMSKALARLSNQVATMDAKIEDVAKKTKKIEKMEQTLADVAKKTDQNAANSLKMAEGFDEMSTISSSFSVELTMIRTSVEEELASMSGDLSVMKLTMKEKLEDAVQMIDTRITDAFADLKKDVASSQPAPRAFEQQVDDAFFGDFDLDQHLDDVAPMEDNVTQTPAASARLIDTPVRQNDDLEMDMPVVSDLPKTNSPRRSRRLATKRRRSEGSEKSEEKIEMPRYTVSSRSMAKSHCSPRLAKKRRQSSEAENGDEKMFKSPRYRRDCQFGSSRFLPESIFSIKNIIQFLSVFIIVIYYALSALFLF